MAFSTKGADPAPALIGLLLALLATASQAQCQLESDVLGAHYRITSSSADSARTQEIVLWRQAGRLLHEQADGSSAQLWERTANGQVRLVQFYDPEHRGIEYQPEDLSRSDETLWITKRQIIAPAMLEKMTLMSRSGEGCARIEHYTLRENDSQHLLDWRPEQQLLERYLVDSPDQHVEWQLIRLESDHEVVDAAFADRNGYQTTDYADIGDNESDPFLLKMINLGFIEHGSSGIYDHKGREMGDTGTD